MSPNIPAVLTAKLAVIPSLLMYYRVYRKKTDLRSDKLLGEQFRVIFTCNERKNSAAAFLYLFFCYWCI